MSRSLFTYGTLEAPEIMAMVAGSRFGSQPGILNGFARFLLRGRAYPGIVTASGASVTGTLYLGVDASALALLDEFEDHCYERRMVQVQTAGNVERAFAYVISDRFRHLVDTRPWDREAFLASKGAEFLQAWARRSEE